MPDLYVIVTLDVYHARGTTKAYEKERLKCLLKDCRFSPLSPFKWYFFDISGEDKAGQ